MSISKRLARGVRRAAPTGALTILWFGFGYLGFTLFFQDATERTIPLMIFVIIFGVGVWIPFFRFFFLIAEEVLLPERAPTWRHGATVGLSVALVAIPLILLLPGTALAEPIQVLVVGPIILTLVGINRAQRMQRPGADI